MKAYPVIDYQPWMNSSVYKLENQFLVTVEFSPIYGDAISRIDMPDGITYWHCSSGTLPPEFAREWIRGGNGPDAKLVDPRFEIDWENAIDASLNQDELDNYSIFRRGRTGR